MMWLTWRQFRAQAVVTSALLAGAAAVLVFSGMHLAHLYDTSGIVACQAHGDCQTLASNLTTEFRVSGYEYLFNFGVFAMYLTPALIGLFWGAPLVSREIEAGTLRLTWNQSISRTRWLATKLALVGLVAMAAAGLLSLALTWSASPIFKLALQTGPTGGLSISRFDPGLFGAQGIVPVGYAAFAFVLGVAMGVLIHRTLPAMAVTLVIFAAIQIAMPLWVRPHLVTPAQTVSALSPANINGIMMSSPGGQMTVTASTNLPGAWVLSNQTIKKDGQVFSGPAPHACGNGGPQECQAAIGQLHLRQLVTYQPANRFWAFQWYETGIFLALAAALAGLCFWRVRSRRVT